MDREQQVLSPQKTPADHAKQGQAGFRYMPALDGLRAIAILLVLFTHGIDDVPQALQKAASTGWSGVDLFFVLSGFLITGGLLKTKSAANYFESFYGRRILRIFPVFYLSLIITFGVLPFFLPSSSLPPSHDRPYYWLYLNNWAPLMQTLNVAYVGHFWSLAVEEQFYLVWPAIVLLLSTRQLFGFAISGIIGAPVLRAILLFSGTPAEVVYRNTFCRLDALMMGALCALCIMNPESCAWIRKHSSKLALFGISGWVASMIAGGEGYGHFRMLILGLSANAIWFGMILLSCTFESNKTNWLAILPLRKIGIWSYGIYVYHLAFVHLTHLMPLLRPGLLRLGTEILLAIGTAALSYHFFEQPILRYKNHFVPVWANRSLANVR